jgi:hypothetical protein
VNRIGARWNYDTKFASALIANAARAERGLPSAAWSVTTSAAILAGSGKVVLNFSYTYEVLRAQRSVIIRSSSLCEFPGYHELARPISDGARSLAGRAARDRTARDCKPRCQFR